MKNRKPARMHRFYTRRTHSSDGHLVIHDVERMRQPLPVHENDADFVCAAMNAADRQEKECDV